MSRLVRRLPATHRTGQWLAGKRLGYGRLAPRITDASVMLHAGQERHND
jgi:hypothetical protein